MLTRLSLSIVFAVSVAGPSRTAPFVDAEQKDSNTDFLNHPRPSYVLNLSLNEFSILNVSEMDGLLKYGGSGDFQLHMAKEGSNVVWKVQVDDPRLMELLGIFIGEKTIKLVQTIDPNNVDPNQKVALESIKSLTRKMEEAQTHPIWKSVRLAGRLAHDGTNWVLKAKDNTFTLRSKRLDELNSLQSNEIVAEGFVKVPGEFEMTRFLEKRPNTLELFVMSLCPFARRAESRLIAFLAQTNANPEIRLEVHYIFYRQQKDGHDVFFSLHGEEEVVENLVQIAIRDYHPELLHRYLQLRAASGETPWSKVAEQVALNPTQIAEIASLISTQRADLLRREYEYTAGRYQITDGSPSYVWESERVTDLRSVDAFKGLDAVGTEACSH